MPAWGLTPVADIRGEFGTLTSNIANFSAQGLHVQMGRSLIAVAQVLTLVLSTWASLTADVLGREPTLYCDGVRRASLFCLGQVAPTETGRWLGILIGVAVLSGIAPRVTGWAHAWLAISMNASLSLPDGGEAIASFATVFLAVILLGDPRPSAWARSRADPPRLRAVAYAASLGLCVQVAGVYFESGLSKIAVPEWQDGTAMYFIIRDPYFGATGLIAAVLRWFTSLPAGTALLTWGTIVVECAIATLIILPWRWKRYAFVLVLLLHVGIAVALGLWSFSLIMIGTTAVTTYRLDSTVSSEVDLERAHPEDALLVKTIRS